MANRVVIKIGSSLLTTSNGALDISKLQEHVKALAQLAKMGKELLLVSSGAIAAGFSVLGYKQRPTAVSDLQASAAVGQGLLMHAYREAFRTFNLEVGQLLLTRHDFAKRDSYNNALNAIEVLLEKKVVPIINENDTVVLRNFAFGDNDMLSALVSALVHADRLCVLTDQMGLYDKNPDRHADAVVVKEVPVVSDQVLETATESVSSVGTGGMKAKLLAARRALQMGVPVYIGSGHKITAERLLSIFSGKEETGTYFGRGETTQLNRKKQWIAFHSEVKGQVYIDLGAASALLDKGKSLLPVGILSVHGSFTNGDVVEVYSSDNQLLGKGITEYQAITLQEALGRKTSFAKQNLGVEKVEVIHRDNWVQLA